MRIITITRIITRTVIRAAEGALTTICARLRSARL
jgi:hypothetical protein